MDRALGQNSVKGTKFKLNINMPPIDGYSLEAVDWSAEVFTKQGCKSLTVEKKDAIKVDKDTYRIPVDSAIVGAGEYWVTLTAQIPDTDFSDGFRPEVRTRPAGVTIDPR